MSEPEDKPPGDPPPDDKPPDDRPATMPVIEMVARSASDAEHEAEQKKQAEAVAMEKVVAAVVAEQTPAAAVDEPPAVIKPEVGAGNAVRRYLRGKGGGPLEVLITVVLAVALLAPGIGRYTLVDPWETHYSEVARRMLQDDDLVHTQWQNEGFRSKPVLTFWMIAAGLRSFGFAQDGGYSGEMVSSPWVMVAARLPFVLFGILGMCVLWWALARLINRRVAWLAFLMLGTTPFYFFVARQAITDIPMVCSLIAAMCFLAMALHAPEEPLKPFLWRFTAYHVFLAVFAGFLGWQAIYYARYFWDSPQLAAGVDFAWPHLLLPLGMVFAVVRLALWRRWTLLAPIVSIVTVPAGTVIAMVAGGATNPHQAVLDSAIGALIGMGLAVAAAVCSEVLDWPRAFWRWWWQPTTSRRQVWMYWFYFLLGISVLAKGLPGIGMAGASAFLYILLTNSWRRLAELEIPRGVHIVFWVVVPWHLAMYLKDGRPFIRDYIFTHNLKRATAGVHGERGTFDFFMQQLGIGMWPWIALLPAAVAHVATRLRPDTRDGRARLLFGVWAVVGIALFSLSETKFHHYVLPAVPALVVLIALWLDDLLERDGGRSAVLLLAGIGVVILVGIDLMGEHKQFIEMFVYRYDRPWPDVDFTPELRAFTTLFAGLLLLLLLPWIRTWVIGALLAGGLGFALWAMHVYMPVAGTHWGMRTAVQRYYQDRQIYGVDIRYYGMRQLADEWDGSDGYYRVDSYIPDQFAAGLPMTVRISLMRTLAQPDRTVELAGWVYDYDDHGFDIAIPPIELAKLAPLIEQGRGQEEPGHKPWKIVSADRLIAWQLYWRGENFWSGDEIWSESPDTKTAFKNTDNKEFLDYLEDPSRAGRRFYVITEAGRATGLKNILPTRRSKDTFEILDTSSNKFTLLTFTL